VADARALVLLAVAASLAVPTAALAQDAGAGAVRASARDSHASAQLAVLARAADLIVRIDRVGDGFIRPVAGPISSRFGMRSISVAGNRFHGGVDIAADVGTAVAAARGGIVVRVGWGGAYGYHVVLDHGAGWETRYAHLSRIDVREGERLRQGAVVGLVGSTGASTGPHLHFEIRHDGRALDPLAYVGR
jgi:murein DD-endopeptidase MepM/ murein hydrolase activator NlpD